MTPLAVTAGEACTTTLIGCGSATGTAIPPFLIFAGKRMMTDLMDGATPGAVGRVSDSGRSNRELFREYLEEHFLKYVSMKADQKALLLLNGHKSHISVGLLQWAKERNIILFIVPAHTSHILQPLDVGCYGPMQRKFNAECHIFTRESQCVVTRYNVGQLVCKVYSKALSADLISSFRKTGIYPCNRNAIPAASLIHARYSTLKKTISIPKKIRIIMKQKMLYQHKVRLKDHTRKKPVIVSLECF